MSETVFASSLIWAAIMRQLPTPAHRVNAARTCRAAAAALAHPEVWEDLSTPVKHGILNKVCMNPASAVCDVRRAVILYSIDTYDENCIIATAKNGRLDILQWLHDRLGISDEACTISMYVACTRGNVDIMKWLSGMVEMSPPRLSALLDEACVRGYLRAALWLIDDMGATLADEGLAFFGACRRGSVELVGVLVDRFGFLIQSCIRDAMSFACEGGNLEVARWLDATYQVDSSTICDGEFSPLEFACTRGGSTELVDWLVDRYGVTSEDIRKDSNIILRRVCCQGLVRMAECIVDTFGLTAEDVRESDCQMLVETCQGEEDHHLAMAQWLFDRFWLSADDLRGVRKLRGIRSRAMREWIEKVREGR